VTSPPEELWRAISTPEFTAQYFHGAPHHRDLNKLLETGKPPRRTRAGHRVPNGLPAPRST
jgi:uncharacterized protein YndB with AHSA1/START domain